MEKQNEWGGKIVDYNAEFETPLNRCPRERY